MTTDTHRNLRDLLATYPEIDPSESANPDDYNGTDVVLLERSRLTQEVWVTFHGTLDEALNYNENQEYAEDWGPIAVFDLTTCEDLSACHAPWPVKPLPTLSDAIDQADGVMMIEDRAPYERRLIEFAIDIYRWHRDMELGIPESLGVHSGADQLQALYEILNGVGLDVA